MKELAQSSFATGRAVRKYVAANDATAQADSTLSGQEFPLPPAEIKRSIQLYAANPLFKDTKEWLIEDNPYRRPIHQSAVRQLDFTGQLARHEVFSASALAAHRMLLNIYETDLIFLPERDFAAKKMDFERFYSNENKLLGELIRPTLEAHVFGFFEEEINITGKWSVEALKSYLDSLVEQHEQTELEICAAVLSSRDPEKAALSLMVQVAGDFLSEASASARNVLGKYGAIQSELFKILIDDYGYGVHQAKHSTLFENTMATCGLVSDVHTYWQFYLGSSLALNNYYHYVSRDHSKYFRAIGAIAVAEAMFSHSCRKISEMLHAVFGDKVDTYYFDEHYHIDAHHGRMAFERVVAPAIARCGDAAIGEVVRGVEELRLITALADEDFMAQVAWFDEAEKYKAEAQQIHRRILSRDMESRKATHVERQHQLSVTQVHDHDELCIVEFGALDLVAGCNQSIRLNAGEGIVIPRHRLHGATIASEECVYHTYEIEGDTACSL